MMMTMSYRNHPFIITALVAIFLSSVVHSKPHDDDKCSIVIGGDHAATFPHECDDVDSITMKLEDGSSKTFSKKNTIHRDGYKATKKTKKDKNGRRLVEEVDVAGHTTWYGEESSLHESGSAAAVTLLHTDTGLLMGHYVDTVTGATTTFSISPDGTIASETQTPEDFLPEDDIEVPDEDKDNIFLRRTRESRIQDDQERMLRGFKSQVVPQDSRNLATTHVIDLMIVWTSYAECLLSGLGSNCKTNDETEAKMRAKLELHVDQTNTAYQDSGINVVLRLVYAYCAEDYDNENRQSGRDHLIDIRNGRNGLEDVKSLADNYGADMVSFVTKMNDSCGIGYRPKPPLVQGHSSYMYSATSYHCMSGYTLSHELGHNMGCTHDRAITNHCNTKANGGHNYGYVDPKGRWVTIMSYTNRQTGSACRGTRGRARILRFANYDDDDKTAYNYEGHPTGTRFDKCAQNINDNAAMIASYREAVYTPPTQAPTPQQPPPDTPSPQKPRPEKKLVVDEDFEGGFGAYWMPIPGSKAQIKEGKYRDAFNPAQMKGSSVELKKNAAMYTSPINTRTYTSMQVSFVVMFKKMLWEDGEYFHVQYSLNQGAYRTLMRIGKSANTQYAVNNEGSWHHIDLDIDVNDADNVVVKLTNSGRKGASYVDHTVIFGVSESSPSPTTAPPTDDPSVSPSSSLQPSISPTTAPSKKPSSAPSLSLQPTNKPSNSPSLSQQPSASPTGAPTDKPSSGPTVTVKPSIMPSDSPSSSRQPSVEPSIAPSKNPTLAPTVSAKPSTLPSDSPSSSQNPSTGPSGVPSAKPSSFPTISANPSNLPSGSPTFSHQPSIKPTSEPSSKPSLAPSLSHGPSGSPSSSPSDGTVLEPRIDYQNFNNGNAGRYWSRTDMKAIGNPKSNAVKLKKTASIFTQTELETTGYNIISLQFNLMFKKVEWKKGDKFLIEVQRNSSGQYTPLMVIQRGRKYAWNNLPNWFLISQDVPVGGAEKMSFRLRLVSLKKGEAYIDNLQILWHP